MLIRGGKNSFIGHYSVGKTIINVSKHDFLKPENEKLIHESSSLSIKGITIN